MPKYPFLQRSLPAQKREQPSPAQMQDMYAAFNAWKEKFKENILDTGGKLMPSGKVARAHWTIVTSIVTRVRDIR